MDQCADFHRVVLNYAQIFDIRFGVGFSKEFADRTDDQAERCLEFVGDILEEGFLLAGLLHQFVPADPLCFQIPPHGDESDETIYKCADNQQIGCQHGHGKIPWLPYAESDQFRLFRRKVRV